MKSGGKKRSALSQPRVVEILQGDVIDALRTLKPNSVDCVVTSPPYWGLRDYNTGQWIGGDPKCKHKPTNGRQGKGGARASRTFTGERPHKTKCPRCGAVRVDKQLGLEPSLGEHLDAMVAVFAEIHRVLKPSGTVWLNYGDCYATAPNGTSVKDAKQRGGKDDRTFRDKPFATSGEIYPDRLKASHGVNFGTSRDTHDRTRARAQKGGVLKPGDLCMVANRLAIALQEWGWWIKSEIIWGKKNPMPDSNGSTRPSSAHEKIFLLAKSDSVELWRARDTGEVSTRPNLEERVPFLTRPDKEGPRWIRMPYYYDAQAVSLEVSDSTHARVSQNVAAQIGSARANAGAKTNGNMKAVVRRAQPKAAAADEQGRRVKNNSSMNAALAVTPLRRYLRNYEEAPLGVWAMATEAFKDAHFATFPPELVERCLQAGCPPGGLVLDPFGGSGTTAMVADGLGMRAMLIELSPAYVEIAYKRIVDMFRRVEVREIE